MRRFVPALVMGAMFLLPGIPALAQSTGPDHLICYQMHDSLKNVRPTFELLAPQTDFSQNRCQLQGAVEFCVPASKVGVSPPPAFPAISGQSLNNDYVCYNVRCRRPAQPADRIVTDQFGERVERDFQVDRICVPASKAPLPCVGTNGEGGACGGVCPSGKHCEQGRGTAGCQCVSNTCGGKPDAAGVCGGTCDNPSETCRQNVDGLCQCQGPPRPSCEDQDFPGCGAPCADPTKQCQPGFDSSGNAVCECKPPPTGGCSLEPGTSPPACGGSCPSGSECELIPTSAGPSVCACVQQIPPPRACGDSAPSCGGFCPTGSECQSGPVGSTTCTCVPLPCDERSTCGGPCTDPNGQTGTCLSGSTAAGGTECVCATCGTDPAAPCSGTCPPGKACGQPAGATTCGCN